MPDRYHTGWNFEDALFSEDPACHEEWQVAANSLMAQMREYADDDDAQALGEVAWDEMSPESQQAWFSSDEAPAMVATVDSILNDDPPVEPQDFAATVEDHDYRRVAFWLRKVMCENPDHLGGDGE